MAADGDCHHLCKLMAPVRHRWSISDSIGEIRNTFNEDSIVGTTDNKKTANPDGADTKESCAVYCVNVDSEARALIDNITPLDISLELRYIKNSSPGPDQITYNILRQLPPKALNYLAELYTGSLRLGHTPKRWKHSHILLFPKPGKDASDPQNYRPISLTSTLAKLMEKVLVSRLHVYMRNRNLLPTTQAGFRPGAQLHDQLIRVLTPIEEAYTRRHYSILIALDAKRAFDTVWIDALKYKLTSLNLPHEITRWLSSFISNRTGQLKRLRRLPADPELRSGAGSIPAWGDYLVGFFPRFSLNKANASRTFRLGPFFFIEATVTGNVYLDMCRTFVVDQLPQDLFFSNLGLHPITMEQCVAS
ncbi:hypothetical protein ANN_09179 [Periplaneta americana]|uniref:Reverse transcriptase domain-containing protein n=1 Tax=Periplaneta americana TaxID=6978 RepID=A0ABQ8TKN2_PERAM|nr:hypothetical protein ANN_09179 [Periplaneta americana]